MLRAIRSMAVFLLLTGLACAVSGAQADESTATIRGTVYDLKGAVIPDATVTAKNPATGVTRTTVTGPDGRYQIPQLNPATYEVQASAPGFQSEEANEVVLTVGQIAVLDGRLAVGHVESVVVVNGNVTPLIDVNQTQQANTLDEEQIQNLPNASRNFLNEVSTLPGVGSTAAAQAQNQGFYYASTGISLGSSNGRGNLITVNSGEDDYGTGAVRYYPPLDAIQETQVNRNGYQAEFGFASGAAIDTITKSGSNQFHADVFGFFNDEITDAETYLSRLDRADPATGAVPPKPFSQQVYAGGSVGGPIVKNKLFYFASYEYQRFDAATTYPLLSSEYVQPFNGSLNDTSCLNASVANPNLAPSQGCFFRALAGAAAIDPADAALAAAFLASPDSSPQNPNAPNPFFPLSSTTLTQLLTRDNGTFDTPSRNHVFTSRFDYQANNTNTVTGTFSLQHGDVSIGGLAPDGITNITRDYEGLVDWVHIFSPTLFNKLLIQAAYNLYNETTPNSDGPEIQIQYLPGPAGSLGHNFADTYLATEHRFEFSDSVSLSKGHHNAKFGFSYRPAQYIVNNPNYIQGEFDFFGGFPITNPAGSLSLPMATGFSGFSSVVPYLAAAAGFCPTSTPCVPSSVLLTGAESFDDGVPYSFEGSSGSGRWSGWAQYAGIYAEDSWKPTQHLTLTYGGRVDWDAEPSPLRVYKFFSPRVGLAWAPTNDNKTVVRLGGGAFVAPTDFLESLYTNLYGPVSGPNKYLTNTAVNITQPGGSYEAYTPIVDLFQANNGASGVSSPTSAQETAVGLAPGVFGRLTQTIDSHFTSQKVYQASLSVAQQLTRNLSLELGYIFYRGNHLPAAILVGYEPEASVPIDPVIGPTYAEVAPYTTLLPGGSPFDFSSNGVSIYNGATASLIRRLSHHFQFQANYTYSRSIDDATDFNTAFASFRPNGLSLAQERGVSDFNHTHVFVADAVYNTFGNTGQRGLFHTALENISLGPVLSASSGAPFDVDISSPFTNGTPLGNLTARPYHAQRNSGQGPGFISFDLKASKGVALNTSNTKRLAITMDGTNLFNRQNYSSVYNFFPSAQNGTFGPHNVPVNFATGPFNFRGGKPTTVTQQDSPLYFNTQSAARSIQLGVRFEF